MRAEAELSSALLRAQQHDGSPAPEVVVEGTAGRQDRARADATQHLSAGESENLHAVVKELPADVEVLGETGQAHVGFSLVGKREIVSVQLQDALTETEMRE